MNMDTVRMNITVPKDILRSLNRLAGHRKRSQFIVEALKQRIIQKEKEDLDKLLAEGYKATSKESSDIAKEFESVDLEGWDEY